MIDPTDEKQIGVGAFKSRCLSLIDEVANGKTRRVLLMRHNRPVAAIVPIEPEVTDLWGAMRGTVTVAPETALTAELEEAWKANA